jgi:hypothetical protein
MNYYIAIPSYKRASICNSKTLLMLHNLGISKDKINIFVIEEDYENYSNILNTNYYNKIIIGYEGLVQQREFIENYYEDGTHLIMIDDDLAEIDLSMTNYECVDDFFKYAFSECVAKNAFIWGIYPVYNKFFRNDRQILTTNLTYIVGCLYGIIVRKLPELKLVISREGNKEDVERSILYWLKDGILLRFNKVAVKTKYYGSDGGGLGRMKDRLKIMEETTKKINEKYPSLTKIKIRKNGLYEIIFNTSAKPNVDNDIPKYLNPIEPNDELIQEIITYLSLFKVPIIEGKGKGRGGLFGRHRSMTLGMIEARISKKYGLSYNSKKYPELYESLMKLGKRIVPFDFNAIHVNNNVVCPRHLDPYNVSNSVIVSIGDYEGCKLVIEDYGTYDTNCRPLMFNGSKYYHYNTPLISGDKYSFVFFTNHGRKKN